MSNYLKDIMSLVERGNMMTGADFRIEIEDCPNLSKLAVTCTPELPSRHPVENVPFQGGIEMNQPGHSKTGGMFPITFQDAITAPAIEEYADWLEHCRDAGGAGLKKVRVYATDHDSDLKSKLDITYIGGWPEGEAPDFDAENKTAPMKITLNLHFAFRMWTRDDVSSQS